MGESVAADPARLAVLANVRQRLQIFSDRATLTQQQHDAEVGTIAVAAITPELTQPAAER